MMLLLALGMNIGSAIANLWCLWHARKARLVYEEAKQFYDRAKQSYYELEKELLKLEKEMNDERK